MKAKFTIFVLLYGDYAWLTERCLNSILTQIPPDHLNLRIGMNEVSGTTSNYVEECVKLGWLPQENVYESTENIHKYPLMHRMFNDSDNPITTPYTMWFDDDSYLRESANDGPPWLTKVEAAMINADMIGGKYSQDFAGNQTAWVEQQSWYTGRAFLRKGYNQTAYASFITGGWWTMRTEILRTYDYPWDELDHRGGDVMLGEMLRQQGKRVVQFREGVAINADPNGVESRATKRGFNSKPIGYNYDPGVAASVHRAGAMVAPVVATRKKGTIILDL